MVLADFGLAESFAMIRGDHADVTVMGTFRVIEVTPGGLLLEEIYPGLTPEYPVRDRAGTDHFTRPQGDRALRPS